MLLSIKGRVPLYIKPNLISIGTKFKFGTLQNGLFEKALEKALFKAFNLKFIVYCCILIS